MDNPPARGEEMRLRPKSRPPIPSPKGRTWSRRCSVGGSFFDAGEMGEVINKKGPPGEFGQAQKRLAPFLYFFKPEAHAGNDVVTSYEISVPNRRRTAANNSFVPDASIPRNGLPSRKCSLAEFPSINSRAPQSFLDRCDVFATAGLLGSLDLLPECR